MPFGPWPGVTGGGGGFPGFGGAPPAVALASAGGASGLASRSDHTHAAAVLNLAAGAGITAVPAAGTWTISATATTFPGFGPAPGAVASASSAGAAGTASRSDHTHALNILAYNPSPAAMQATGVIQQTYAAPTATPTVLPMVVNQVPYGAATGLLQQSGQFLATVTAATATIEANGTNSGQFVMNATTNTGTLFGVKWRFAGTNFIQLNGQIGGAGTHNLFRTQMTALAGGDGLDKVDWTNTAVGQTIAGITLGATGDAWFGSTTAIAPAGTTGFLWIPTSTGRMTGVPTLIGNDAASRQPIVVDPNDQAFYWRNQGTNAWHYVTFTDYDPTATRVPFGGATAHTLTDAAGFTFATATRALTLGTTGVGVDGSLLVNAGAAGQSIGGGASAGVYVADPNATGRANIAVDDNFFGQRLIGYQNLGLTDLAVGVATGNVFHVQFLMDRVGGGTDALTVDGATGQTAAGLGVTFQVGTAGAEGFQVKPNAAGSDTFLGFQGALAAAATHGYPYIPNVNATPTGAPNAFGGVGAALVYARNTTTLWAYDVPNASWVPFPGFFATVAAGAGVQVTTNIPAGFNTTPKYWSFKDAAGVATVIQFFQP